MSDTVPSLFVINRCMGKECEIFHKNVADKIEQKTGERYEKVISYIRCKISFLALKAASMCLRGSGSSASQVHVVVEDIERAVDELRI